ncbi:MAG: hypothetical protein Q4C71_02645 [Microbacteriaceae bacterium]|nr:hypothetical protein [Microbacteriaceae bacterium]
MTENNKQAPGSPVEEPKNTQPITEAEVAETLRAAREAQLGNPVTPAERAEVNGESAPVVAPAEPVAEKPASEKPAAEKPDAQPAGDRPAAAPSQASSAHAGSDNTTRVLPTTATAVSSTPASTATASATTSATASEPQPATGEAENRTPNWLRASEKSATDVDTKPYTPVEHAEAQKPATGATGTAAASDPKYVPLTIDEQRRSGSFLLTEAPEEPVYRGNRLAGFFITLIATIIFAGLYGGFLYGKAFLHGELANLGENTQQILLNIAGSNIFLFPVIAFFVGLLLLVLIFGRSGWWAYVLGSFPVAVAVWWFGAFGFAIAPQPAGAGAQFGDLFSNTNAFLREVTNGSHQLVLIFAGLIAREVIVWFGAWIGARGRKMKAENRELRAGYEAALEEHEKSLAEKR